MIVRLFHSPASPYVRKVRVTAHERGVADRIELLDCAAWPVKRDPDIVKHNATGKVPCLLVEGDEPVFDSRVICAYVDAMGVSGDSVYPGGENRFRVLTLEALADSILDAALLARYESVLRPGEFRWDLWHDSQMEKVESGLDALERRWFDLLAQDFHAGAIATACMLGYLDFRFGHLDWRASHPKLAEWFKTVSERASIRETMPA